MTGVQRIEIAAATGSVALGVLAFLLAFVGLTAAALVTGVFALVPAAFSLGMVIQRNSPDAGPQDRPGAA